MSTGEGHLSTGGPNEVATAHAVETGSEQTPAVSVVIPTYNEADNLPALVERLDEALGDQPGGYELIVVDDDSPDGTWRVAHTLAGPFPVRVVRRRDASGLATAVAEGFRVARADRLVVMDADLQHPPGRVPDLLAALEEGADVAVGSRHTDGGSMGSFGPLRRAISWGADTLARTLLPATRGVSDLQSGFFAVRRSVVEDAELDPVGYKILLEILVQGEVDDVVEVGYTFGEREHGSSKLDAGSVVDYLRHLGRLTRRSGERRRMGQFALVGAIGAVVNLLAMFLLTRAGSHYLLASGLAIEAGLLSNFVLNRSWTFRDRAPTKPANLLRALGRDHVVRSGGMAVNLGVLWALTALVGLFPLGSQAVGIGAAVAWNYVGNTWWTWETGREASPEAREGSGEQGRPRPGTSRGW